MKPGISIQFPNTARILRPDLLADPDRLLDVHDVAAVLSVKASWCYNDRSMPWFKVGKYRKIRARDVSAWLEAARTASTVMRHSRAQEIVDKLEAMD